MNNILVKAKDRLNLQVRLIALFFTVVWISFCSSSGQTVSLQWNPETNSLVAGYLLLYGNASQNYTETVDVGTNTLATFVPPALGTNYYFVVKSYTTNGVQSDPSDEVSLSIPPSLFFSGQVGVTNTWNFLQFPDGAVFGYYELSYFPWIFHIDMGYEYVFDAKDSRESVYLYDNSSGTFFYTNPSIFPYLYDFTLNAWLYYYPDKKNAGRYTSSPRYFYDFADQKVITK